MPASYGSGRTGIAYQQRTVGDTADIVCELVILFIFLVLAAQFENLSTSLSIILVLPMYLPAATVGINLRGFDSNVLIQIGLIVLTALTIKAGMGFP